MKIGSSVWRSVRILGCLLLVVVGLQVPVGLAQSSVESEPHDTADMLAVAEMFLDGFYAWEPERLKALAVAGEHLDQALYYQAWAQAANYRILNRRACKEANGAIVCAVTVSDDFGATLGYTATDTFTLTVRDGKVVAFAAEGDDPFVFAVLFLWMSLFRAEVMAGPCQDMFAGGTTPAACSRAVFASAKEFAAFWPFIDEPG